jgi:hypothetical protein
MSLSSWMVSHKSTTFHLPPPQGQPAQPNTHPKTISITLTLAIQPTIYPMSIHPVEIRRSCHPE